MTYLKEYWPILILSAWFGMKWLRSRRVMQKLPELKNKGAIMVDVRSPAEFASGNAPGTLNIPLQEIGQRLKEIPSSVPVIVGCASGTRSGMAAMILKKNGYKEVYNIGSWTNFLKG